MPSLSPASFARVAKALADPQRCEILERFAAGAFCCSALLEIFPLTQATVSHHLRELTEAGLLGRQKRGQLAYYFFRPETMEAYLDELARRMRLRPAAEASNVAARRLGGSPDPAPPAPAPSAPRRVSARATRGPALRSRDQKPRVRGL